MSSNFETVPARIKMSADGTKGLSIVLPNGNDSGLPAFNIDPVTGESVGIVGWPGRVSNSIVLIGDSLTDNNYINTSQNPVTWSSTGYFTWANILLGQRFNILNESGIGGNTSAQVLARLQENVISYQPQYCCVMIGINDVFNSVATATVIANLTAIYKALKAAGITIIACTVTPGTFNTTAKIASWSAINAFITDYANKYPGVILVDTAAAFISATDGAPISGATSDGIHPTTVGAQLLGRAFYEVLDPIIPKLTTVNSAQTLIAPAKNVLMNGLAFGSNASGVNGFSLGTGCTGVGPNNWQIARSGTSTAVASKVTSTDWRSRDWFRAAVTTGSANDQVNIGPIDVIFINWSSGGGATVGRLVRPTVYNGCNYRVTTGGSFAAGADPTASYSTVLGTSFVDGTATLQVVDSCDSADTMFAQCKVNMSIWSGLVVPVLQVWQYTSGYGSLIKKAIGLNWAAADALPSFVPSTTMVLRTPNFAIDPTTAIIHVQMGVYAGAGVTGNLDVTEFELRKAYLPTTFTPVA